MNCINPANAKMCDSFHKFVEHYEKDEGMGFISMIPVLACNANFDHKDEKMSVVRFTVPEAHMDFRFRNVRLCAMYARPRYAEGSMTKLYDLLKAQYGDPTSVETHAWQNAFGARWVTMDMLWNLPNGGSVNWRPGHEFADTSLEVIVQ